MTASSLPGGSGIIPKTPTYAAMGVTTTSIPAASQPLDHKDLARMLCCGMNFHAWHFQM